MARVRLQRYLSQAGVAARRKAEALIVAGRVRVNGRTVTELGTSIDPAVDQVTVDGEAAHPQELFYCVLNKPKGTITAVTDPEGRPTVMEYLPNLPVPVKPVGRLDFYSEGVLLLTNDGELSAALQSPRNHVEKTYHVKLRGNLRQDHLEIMRRGVRLDDGTMTRPAQIDYLRSKSRHDWLVITLTEGKSRQIHRMAEALGYQVLKLQRVAFAGLDYYGLRVGDARELTQAELTALRGLVGLPRSSVAAARGRWRSRREDSELARRARGRQRAEGSGAEPAADAPPRDRALDAAARTASRGPARRAAGHAERSAPAPGPRPGGPDRREGREGRGGPGGRDGGLRPDRADHRRRAGAARAGGRRATGGWSRSPGAAGWDARDRTSRGGAGGPRGGRSGPGGGRSGPGSGRSGGPGGGRGGPGGGRGRPGGGRGGPGGRHAPRKLTRR